MRVHWKVCINLKSSKGNEKFYNELGFKTMTADECGSGMEKMLDR